uniref:30S ribosomal protein S8, chloroplastic n=1 Tax=Populus trichocarpa TaxID=3694 RepID=A0A2K1Y5J0_POPTR
MGRDTLADIITSIRNADMDRKGTVRIPSTNITETLLKYFYEKSPCLRIYSNYQQIPRILGGMGIVIFLLLGV